jgi:hypothetical protein
MDPIDQKSNIFYIVILFYKTVGLPRSKRAAQPIEMIDKPPFFVCMETGCKKHACAYRKDGSNLGCSLPAITRR